MKIGDEIIYSIKVDCGQKPATQVSKELQIAGVPLTNQVVDYVSNTISVPRLFTKYRGDDKEKEFVAAVESVASAKITVDPWSYARGYPKGEIGEPTGRYDE